MSPEAGHGQVTRSKETKILRKKREFRHDAFVVVTENPVSVYMRDMAECGGTGQPLHMRDVDTLFREPAEQQVSVRVCSDCAEISCLCAQAAGIDGDIYRVPARKCQAAFLIVVDAVVTDTGDFHDSVISLILRMAAAAASEGVSM